MSGRRAAARREQGAARCRHDCAAGRCRTGMGGGRANASVTGPRAAGVGRGGLGRKRRQRRGTFAERRTAGWGQSAPLRRNDSDPRDPWSPDAAMTHYARRTMPQRLNSTLHAADSESAIRDESTVAMGSRERGGLWLCVTARQPFRTRHCRNCSAVSGRTVCFQLGSAPRKRQGGRLEDAARNRARHHIGGERRQGSARPISGSASGFRPVAAANTTSPSSGVWTG